MFTGCLLHAVDIILIRLYVSDLQDILACCVAVSKASSLPFNHLYFLILLSLAV